MCFAVGIALIMKRGEIVNEYATLQSPRSVVVGDSGFQLFFRRYVIGRSNLAASFGLGTEYGNGEPSTIDLQIYNIAIKVYLA